MKRSVLVKEALQGLNWGNFCLLILISTGGLNTKWLLHAQTSWWNHCYSHGQSAGYNIYMYRNKMKQVARVQKWQVIWLACQVVRWVLWWDRLTLGHTKCVIWCSRNCLETYDKIQYSNKGKTMRGMTLDSPLKGKTTETCVAEGTMSIVQPTPRTSQASGHLTLF